MPFRGSRSLALAGAIGALALAGLARPDAASAHAFLVRSAPEPGERLVTTPDQIVLSFTEPFVGGSERVVVRRGGERLDLAKPLRQAMFVRQPLPRNLSGVFVVNWRVLSEDGHLSVGEFAFGVGVAGPLPEVSAGTSAETGIGDVLASWLFFLGLALALGGLASEALVWRRAGGLNAAQRRAPLAAGVGIAAVASLLQLALVTGNRAGGGLRDALDPDDLAGALSTRPGFLTVVILGVLAAAVVLSLLPETRLLALAPLLAAAIASAARGHSSTSGDWWAIPADAVHLAASSLWVGALAHLLLVARRAQRGERRATLAFGVRRYAALALPTVLIALAAGALSALAQFDRLRDLVETGYGQTLLVKGALVVLALGLALVARLLALPSDPAVEGERGRTRPSRLAVLAVGLTVLAALLRPEPLRLVAAVLFGAPLLALGLLPRRRGEREKPTGRRSAGRYAKLAAAAMLAVFAAGVLSALAQAAPAGDGGDGSWLDPLRVGLAGFGLALGTAAAVRALPQRPSRGVRLLRRLAAGEAVALAGALVVAAVLVNLAPPRSPAALAQTQPELGPPPLEGPAIRLADLAGQLVVGVAATERELQFEIVAPSGPARGAELVAEAEQPGSLSADLYPRPCGAGCFTIRFRLPAGTTTVSAEVSAPGWTGGRARFSIAWPPTKERPDLLERVERAMSTVPLLEGVERVTSGPGSGGGPLRFRMSGKRLLATELYRGGAVDVRVLGKQSGVTELAFALPGSRIWYRMWIDDRFRVRRETIISPGHLIRRTFEYPAR